MKRSLLTLTLITSVFAYHITAAQSGPATASGPTTTSSTNTPPGKTKIPAELMTTLQPHIDTLKAKRADCLSKYPKVNGQPSKDYFKCTKPYNQKFLNDVSVAIAKYKANSTATAPSS